MTVVGLPRTASRAGAAGATPPRRRRGRVAAARLGAGLAVLVPIVLISSFITYSLGALSNSDPAATILGQDAATPAAVARLNRALGLNHPLIVQYWNWLTQAAQGNLGRSYFTQIPVAQSIAQRLPVDLSIAVLAVILAVIIGGGAGTIAAVRRGGWFDRGVTVACSAASTLPAFVVGIILVVLFAVTAHLLPANGYVGPSTSVPQWLEHIILPSLALSLAVSADVARQLRTSLVEVLEQNYIVGARVRGLPYRRILVRHALRNAVGPGPHHPRQRLPAHAGRGGGRRGGVLPAGAGPAAPGERADPGHPGGPGPAAGDQLLRDRGQPDREHHAQLAVPDDDGIGA